MIKTALFFLLSFVFAAVNAQIIPNASGAEPKASFAVTVNGKEYQVAEGEELKLDTQLIKPVISIKMAEFKKFDIGSISFNYPRHLSFAYEQDFGYRNWTLSGNNFVAMIFELDAKTGLQTLMDEMIKKFGKKNCKAEDFKKELGDNLFKGKTLIVTLVGQTLTMDCYEIVLNDYKSRFIYLQDSIISGENSQEYESCLKMINATIKFNN